MGYTLAMLMGLVLGLLGAGGSILTVPIFVYLMHIKPVVATAYSLLVVGFAAVIGAIGYWRDKKVHFKEAFSFAIPAMISVAITRTVVLPLLPPMIFNLPKDSFLMVLFSLMMMGAALSMFKVGGHTDNKQINQTKPKMQKLLFGSIFVGFLTGIVGAGGGFLIIPSLMAIFSFSVKDAVGTSLAIVAMNSLAGFNGELSLGLDFDWHMLRIFLSMTFLGVVLGTFLSKNVDDKKLKKFFAWFTFILGVSIFIHELLG